jgi:drug/metabolite transporter (DMT)-like permease
MAISPVAFLVVLACALTWTSFDVLRRVLLEDLEPIPLVFLLTGLQVPLFALWSAVEGEWSVGAGYWLPGLTSVAINIVANVWFVMAIKVSPLSLTIPMLSFTPVFTTLLADLMLGEEPGSYQVLGIALVVVGALALNLRPEPGGTFGDLLRRMLHEKGPLLMLGVALLWSLTPPLDKLAMAESGSALHGLVLSAGVALGLGLYLAVRGRLGQVRPAARRPWLVAAALAASAGALALQLVAIRIVLVAIVETVKRGVGNIAAVAVGAVLFKERVVAWQWGAVVVMAAGVALILL